MVSFFYAEDGLCHLLIATCLNLPHAEDGRVSRSGGDVRLAVLADLIDSDGWYVYFEKMDIVVSSNMSIGQHHTL